VNGIVTDDASGEIYKPRAEYLYYEVDVENLATEYPESMERIRKWVCANLLKQQRELIFVGDL
jgi:hypothetical protein